MTAAMIRRLAFSSLAFLASATLAPAVASDLRVVDAAARHDTNAVRTLIEEGADVNATRGDGVSALVWAAHWDDHEAVRLLLQAGADVNAADDHGVTPLMRASENASVEMTRTLLTAGADARVAQTSGLTSLMMAAHTGNVDLVRLLLMHGAPVNASTTKTSATALMWAVETPHRDVVRLLLENGADVSASTTKGVTPLLAAARNGDIETAQILVAAGADVNQTGSDGTHALPFAIIHGQDEFAMFLLEQGADPNGTIDGIPALHTAVGRVDVWLIDWDRRHGAGRLSGGRRETRRQSLDADRQLALARALLEHGAEPNGRIRKSAVMMDYIGHAKKGAFESFACGTGDLYGATPLWVAAFEAAGGRRYSANGRGSDGAGTRRSGDVLQALLDAGADQHLTTDDGTTPLMVAAGLGRSTFRPDLTRGYRSPGAEAAVRVLLAAGGDINAVNEADFTALHGAAFRGLNEVVRYLVEQGAAIDARDYRGRTPYRLAEGSKQSFQFQAFPETADLLQQLGANTRLGVPGTVQERADRAVGTDTGP